jgi:hypothetical protein
MLAYPSTFTQNLTLYLNQWVKVASGDRVKLVSGISYSTGTNTGYLVFKCSQCSDNWHVGLDNFYPSVADPTAKSGTVVPSVLSDWVKKHRHVCKKYQPHQPTTVCFSCKWPYGAHEESWTGPEEVEAFNVKQRTLAQEESKQQARGMTLKQFTGRKFRDVEDLCESPDIGEKTSTD